MQFVGDICGVFVLTVLTRVLKYQVFSRVSWFLLSETINLLSISHIPMTHLTHSLFFLEQAQVYIYRKFNPKVEEIRELFFQNQDTTFGFQKRVGETSPLPLGPPTCAPDIYIYVYIYIFIYIYIYIVKYI